MKNSCRLLLHIVFLATVNATFAQAPKTLSYQGTLSDSSGLLTGTHNLTFAIYDAASSGTTLWMETSSGVVIASGNVSLTLGKLVPINIQTVKPLWMGITVDSNPEISPRVELSASLYSLGLALPYSATVSSGVGNGGQLINLAYDGDSSVAILRLNYNGTSLSNPFVLTHNGTGAAMVVSQTGTLGTGTIFSLTNSANPQPAIRGNTFGTGSAGIFQIGNPSSTAAAINIQHAGIGNAITANRPIQATQFIGDGSLLTGVSGLTLPYSTNVSAINGNTSLFDITYSGDSSVNMVRLTYADSSTLANPFVINHAGQGAGFVLFQTGTLGTGGIFQLSNSANPQPAVRAQTFGTGHAGNFQVSNPGNTSAAINITHNGTGNAITANRPIQATQFIGDGSLLTGVSGLTLPYSTNVSAINGNTSLFDITYSGDSSVNMVRLTYADSSTLANPFVINHAGQGAGFVLFQTGTLGTGGIFQLSNSANPQPAVRAQTFGTGHAGNFQVSNPSNTSAAINISHSGTGNAITANRPIQATKFIGDGSMLTNLPSSGGLTLPFAGVTSSDTTAFAITGNGSASAASFTIANDSSNVPALEVHNAGTGLGINLRQTGNGAGMFIYSSSTTNTQSAFVAQNLGRGSAVHIVQANQVSEPALNVFTTSQSGGILVEQLGPIGAAIRVAVHDFQGDNTFPALDIMHLGTGNAITANRPIQATQFIGDGSLLTNLPSSGLTLPFTGATSSDTTAFTITDNGSASAAYFRMANDSSINPAVQVHNEGKGEGLYLGQSGNGVGMAIVSSSTANPLNPLLVQNYGLGTTVHLVQNNAAASDALVISNHSAASGMQINQLGPNGSGAILTMFDSTSTSPALNIAHFGTGNAITANRPIQASQFIGDGSMLTGIPGFSLPYFNSVSSASSLFQIANAGTGPAASFGISNTGSSATAVDIISDGTGSALYVAALGSGRAGLFQSTGTGSAGQFDVVSPSNFAPALVAFTNGTSGAGVLGSAANSTGNAIAVQGTTNNDGGHGGYFMNQNPANTSASLVAINSGFGQGLNVNLSNTSNSAAGITISHNGNGPAIQILSGGLQYSVAVVNSSSIATRSAAYNISSGGSSFAFAFGSSEGETCIAFNGTGSPITLDGVSLATNETRQLIYIGGAWRGL